MANRRLINLRIDGPQSTLANQPQTKTVSWVTVPLFDSTALGDCGSAFTKTTIPKPAKRAISARQRAQQRIIREKLGSGYIPLACDHYTTYEDQAAYVAHRPRGKYFCDTCGAWRKQRPKPRYTVPDDPPY